MTEVPLAVWVSILLALVLQIILGVKYAVARLRQTDAIEARLVTVERDKVPILECHDRHAADRAANAEDHQIINANLRLLARQGISPANPHPRLTPLPGQEHWEEE